MEQQIMMCNNKLSLLPLLLLRFLAATTTNNKYHAAYADRPLIPVNARTTTTDASKLDTTKVMKGEVLRHDDDDDSEDSDDDSSDDEEDRNNNESYNDLLTFTQQQQQQQERSTKSSSTLSPKQLKVSDTDLLSSIETFPFDEIASILTNEITSSNMVMKQCERTFIQYKYPTALQTTLSQAGNYTDGTPAGSKQWVGDVNEQDPDSPMYASFGSILDISTSSSSSSSHDDTTTLTWIASLIHRQTLVQYTKETTDDELIKECRIDLLDDNDYDNYCFRGVTMDLNNKNNENSREESKGKSSGEKEEEEERDGGYVSIRTNEVSRRQQMILAKQLGIQDHGTFLSLDDKSILSSPLFSSSSSSSSSSNNKNNSLLLNGKKFDTIIANGIVMPTLSDEELHYIPTMDMDLVLERLVKLLKPGGMLYIIGKDPLLYSSSDIDGAEEEEGRKKKKGEEEEEEEEDTYYNGEEGEAGIIYKELMNVFETVKTLSGESPSKYLTSNWVHRTIQNKLGLKVHSSTVVPSYLTYDQIIDIITETQEWIEDGLSHLISEELSNELSKMLYDLLLRADEYKFEGDVFRGNNEYVIIAELPISSSDGCVDDNNENDDGTVKNTCSTMNTANKVHLVGDHKEVIRPTMYEEKVRYVVDQDPAIEELAKPNLKPGEMAKYQWANGDEYDGMSALIGISPHLVETITDYVKGLGIWDIMIDTITKNPMPPDSTNFYNVTSPYGNGERTFTWSAKRPDNFYGSDSDMHWFDAADEASHEDSLRALAKGGFDEVLNAIGTYLGLDHLTTFSIGLLAVTKADKGYVHVDFTRSNKRAMNFLVNLQTPSDEPELTVIEEDDLGNRRRGQVKYSPEFGVLNGDDAMHATNECNHRRLNGVRITASIFISELQEESLETVGTHDEYYFPFGNMDWIWAQRGRHWNKEGTASLATGDKGRAPFVAKDAMEGCEERVGYGKPYRHLCWVNGLERKKCFETCGFFINDDEYHPEKLDRQKWLGW